jgi:anion-transporting  ArsA/GET3 family ATPase
MEAGFRERAAAVGELLASSQTGFVLVTSPRRDAVEEAGYFAARLVDGQFSVESLVVNRVHPHYCDAAPEDLRARASTFTTTPDGAENGEGSAAARRLAARYTNLAEFEDVAARERHELRGLEDAIGEASVVHVPELGHDVHDFIALREVGRHLMAD